MQRRQGVGVSISRNSGLCSRWTASLQVMALLTLCALVCGGISRAQGVNTATLAGTVVDPSGAAVEGAKVTVTNAATGATRTANSDDAGRYNFVGLPPGQYKMSVDGGANFEVYKNESLTLTVGENVKIDPPLVLKGQIQSITVTETPLIEPDKTEVSNTVPQLQIDNLPINGRNFFDFTRLFSKTTRDVSPTIGPAPSSGFNVSGARQRSNLVSVDGADAGDNSVNGIRSTISQEGVQEFQLILSNYNAEYGRATGGVINIVTKGGGNTFHGDLFGFFRNKAFQARNAFSGEVDANGVLQPTKQGYTRTQSGLTFGGPLKKDKTFYFFSYEYTQREETGFSSIGADNFGLLQATTQFIPGATLFLTRDQNAAVQKLLGAGLTNLAAQYEVFMASASSVALNQFDFGAVANGFYQSKGLPPTATPGAQFPVPVACPAGQSLNNGATCSNFGVYVAPLPASYVGLRSIRGNYPVMEKTSLWSARIDHHWNNRNYSFLRVGVSPSLVTGLPSTSQNQVFGQNSGSRAGYNQSRDLNFTFQHDTVVSGTDLNQFRMQIARRGLHFGFSQLPGGDQIAVNIPGFAYFGREPYSPVNRIERRFEFTDNFSFVRGKHNFKVGADANVIQLRSSKKQIFELDFGGDVNFGGFAASTFGFPNSIPGVTALPGTTAMQSYGLGIPTTYIQGIGNSNQPFDNLPFGFFWQDSWRLSDHLTLNYGVRYDVEISPLFAPLPGINAAAEQALGVVEGIPRDYNNVAPRFGLAWDPAGNGKTVVRAGYGIFYDHPLLAVAFDSATADGGRSTQLLSGGGIPSACGLLPFPAGPPPPLGYCGGGADSPGNLNGSSIFQGVLNANSIYIAIPTSLTLGYQANQQRFDPFAAGSLFANQNYLKAGFPLAVLPFTLPVGKNFVYGYAQQANLTIERQISKSWKFSLGYQWTRGLHLNRPQDVNSTDPKLLAQNFANCLAAGITTCSSSPLGVSVPSTSLAPTANTCGYGPVPGAGGILGVLGGCPAALSSFNGSFVSTPAAFNFFRPSGPNPSFGGIPKYPGLVQLAGVAGYPIGFGVPVAFNSVDAQLSNGNSWYNALSLDVSKRLSKGIEVLSSYTWSHAIDDSTDLQSPLEPQDSRFPNLERSNSVNDQRHRWVTSAVMQSGTSKSGDGFFKHFIGGFTLSPIVEFSSGRPFNVITATDTRLDLGASQARPSVGGATTSPFIPGVTFGVASVCLDNSGKPFAVPPVAIPGFPTISPPAGCDGSLGRNRFTSPNFFQWDMRLSKRISLGERSKLDLIADSFNLFNRTNIAAVNQVCDPTAGATCTAGQPTASYDARQFQFALKVSW
jgi:carboxypeptidase family protein/TonB-dependent receptor-like protein